MNEFKCLRSVLSKQGEKEGKTSEMVVKGRTVIRALARVIKGKNVSLEANRDLRVELCHY